MRLRAKQKLDFFLGGFLIAALKPLVVMLGWFMRRDHQLRVGSTLYFIKMQGGGSLVVAYPALLGLRRRYPDTRFVLITTRAVRPFADALGVFDATLEVDDRSLPRLFLSGAKTLIRSFGADTLIDLEVYSRLTAVLGVLTCARNRVGFYLEDVSWRKGIYTHSIFFNRFSGAYHFYDQIARLLDARPAFPSDCREAQIERHGLASTPAVIRRVGIGHACSELGEERMLSPDQWARVFSKRLRADERAEAVFLGGPGDSARAEQILEVLRARFPSVVFRNECGKHSLVDSLRMLYSLDEFWGVDSSLLHFARLFGKRCVSYWGPTDPQTRLRPIPGLNEQVIYRKVPCSPCIHVAERPPCLGHNVCISALFAEDAEGADWLEQEWVPKLMP